MLRILSVFCCAPAFSAAHALSLPARPYEGISREFVIEGTPAACP